MSHGLAKILGSDPQTVPLTAIAMAKAVRNQHFPEGRGLNPELLPDPLPLETRVGGLTAATRRTQRGQFLPKLQTTDQISVRRSAIQIPNGKRE